MNQQQIENPVYKKIKHKKLLRKSSISHTTVYRIQTSIINTIQKHSASTSARNSQLAEQLLHDLQVNSHLTDYLATLEEEICQITQQLAQIQRCYHFAQNLAQRPQLQSFELPFIPEREEKTGLLLSRLNQVLSVSRSYGSKELLKLNHSNQQYKEQETHFQRPPPLEFIHDY